MIYYQGNLEQIINGDCRDMSELPDNSVQCVVTSPPYWGLRKYSGLQDLIWGGDKNCVHEWITETRAGMTGGTSCKAIGGWAGGNVGGKTTFKQIQTNICSLCGAWKGQYGLEPTPEMYVQHTIEILREIRRVLRKDGVVFWNIGDSYASRLEGGQTSTRWIDSIRGNIDHEAIRDHSVKLSRGNLKPKDLCLIPFKVAIAAQEPYQEFTVKELADRAWLAGIIDGEGCIGIHHAEREDRGNHYHQFQPFISVGSIDPPLIERIVRITRMNGTRQKTEPGDIDGRGIISRHANYEWRVEGTNAIKIIEDVFPNLTIKRKQAKIAYELAECHAPHTGKGHKVPPDITTHKLMLWQMIKDCNQRKDIDVRLPDVPQHIEPGWWVRSVIIWSKPNPMPESVTDRPTESHEYILMLTKSARYYWDADAVREANKPESIERYRYSLEGSYTPGSAYPNEKREAPQNWNLNPNGRNIRSVWEFPTQPYPEAHFAVFPEKLPELCIKAATPEVGCCGKCGSPWERVIETKQYPRHKTEPHDLATDGDGTNRGKHSKPSETKTIGWQPTCKCNADKVPSMVLDPFMGAGTTLWVAKKLGRRAVGYELSEEYCQLALERNRQSVMELKV